MCGSPLANDKNLRTKTQEGHLKTAIEVEISEVGELYCPCVVGRRGDGSAQPDNAVRAPVTVRSVLLGFLFAGFW